MKPSDSLILTCKTFLLVVSKTGSVHQLATSQRTRPFVRENASARLVVVHKRFAVKVVNLKNNSV